ncbi:hypothetical protein E2C01_084369 [Portunus trituberculatus]|uniref:Uncharacterized protein n=1 Tax=Portunus trituberculatus TaxID=210409 RepID=A0A5B7J4M0_PORTR|nr:hypothetical protein [Portunus trituberculatus]
MVYSESFNTSRKKKKAYSLFPSFTVKLDGFRMTSCVAYRYSLATATATTPATTTTSATTPTTCCLRLETAFIM